MQWLFLVFGCTCLLVLSEINRENEFAKFILYILGMFFISFYGAFVGLDVASESDVIQDLDQVGIIQIDTNRLQNLTKTDYVELHFFTKKFVDEMQNKMKGE